MFQDSGTSIFQNKNLTKTENLVAATEFGLKWRAARKAHGLVIVITKYEMERSIRNFIKFELYLVLLFRG